MRRAVLLGFGLVIALWGVSAYDLVARLNTLERQATAVGERFNRAERLLTRIRFQVLVSSLAFRDALLDTESLDRRRREILATREAVTEALRDYVPVFDAGEERRLFAELGVGLEEFWESILPVLAWGPDKRAAEAMSVLRQSVSPKRDVILRISDTVRRLNREALARGQAEIAVVHRETRFRIWVTTGILLGLSIAVAAIVIVYAGRLERHLRQQVQIDRENRRALQRLSERLVNAQEQERRAIARELHDEIGQALTAIKMELVVAERSWPPADDRRESCLGEARVITDRALNAVRDLSKLLHPPLLDDLGLIATLEWYLRAFARRTGVRADLQHDGPGDRVAPLVETTAYRIVQEALTNIARHARATSCRVAVGRTPDTIVVAVEDDGVGFDLAARERDGSHQGVGLLGIRERVQNLGGRFHLDSAPGKGTRLTVELPVAVGGEGRPLPPEPLDPLARVERRTTEEAKT